MDFISLALGGKKIDFEKIIIGMIDDLVAELKVEQEADEKKKEYLSEKIDDADDVYEIKAEYLDRKDPCVCHASDITGTFANDATKTSTERTGGHEETTTNVGAERLPEPHQQHRGLLAAVLGRRHRIAGEKPMSTRTCQSIMVVRQMN